VGVPHEPDIELRTALEAALVTCREALGDYQAGLLGDDEVRHILFDAGLVRREREAWLLDLHAQQWWRYDGLAMGAAPAPLTSGGVARLRESIDTLVRELGPGMHMRDTGAEWEGER
jgi:hypothetical protein